MKKLNFKHIIISVIVSVVISLNLINIAHQKGIRDFLAVLTQEIKVLKHYYVLSVNLQRMFVQFLQKENEHIYKEVLKVKESIDHIDYERIKKANFVLENWTNNMQCSGTLIKYKDEFYILTCRHIITSASDFVIARDTVTNGRYYLVLEKEDKKFDLALFRIYIHSNDYVTIASKYPKVGDKVYIIGNPDYLTDILTTGIIVKKTKDSYLTSAPIYYGNSGGAVLNNKGELIGVIRGIAILYTWRFDFREKHFVPVFVSETFSECTSLENIIKFLEE